MNWTNLRKAIIITLTMYGEMSRSELKRKLQTPMTTLYCNLNELELAGYVEHESRAHMGKRGRPTTYWSVIEK